MDSGMWCHVPVLCRAVNMNLLKDGTENPSLYRSARSFDIFEGD
jgi:hypothetical protein